MRKLIAAALVAVSLAATLAGLPASSGASGRSPVCGTSKGRSLDVVGLTSNQRLICFDENRPDDARTIGRVSNLLVDTRLVGIDYRPATGDLYGLGDQAGVYTIDVGTAEATLMSRANTNGVAVVLRGTSFGVDFNPAADRLRVVSDAGQNLRIKVDDGVTVSDGDLNYTPGTAATGVTGAAYTNNDGDPNTNTTLFDVDSMLDQVSIQSPPNNGSLVATGKLGVDSGPDVGADIYSKVRRGSTVSNTAYAALSPGGRSSFYSVDLLTGSVSSEGDFESRNRVIGIAIPLGQ